MDQRRYDVIVPDLIVELPRVNITCRKCTCNLRIWPATLGSNFTCDQPHCINEGFEIVNNGTNRLNCYVCDFDMCSDCAKTILQYNRGACVFPFWADGNCVRLRN